MRLHRVVPAKREIVGANLVFALMIPINRIRAITRIAPYGNETIWPTHIGIIVTPVRAKHPIPVVPWIRGWVRRMLRPYGNVQTLPAGTTTRITRLS